MSLAYKYAVSINFFISKHVWQGCIRFDQNNIHSTMFVKDGKKNLLFDVSRSVIPVCNRGFNKQSPWNDIVTRKCVMNIWNNFTKITFYWSSSCSIVFSITKGVSTRGYPRLIPTTKIHVVDLLSTNLSYKFQQYILQNCTNIYRVNVPG